MSAVAKREFFYGGGEYAGPAGEEVMRGQMYVERLTPPEPRRPCPVAMFHGMEQTATNWLGTPDGRPAVRERRHRRRQGAPVGPRRSAAHL
jgi:hypothetical protein